MVILKNIYPRQHSKAVLFIYSFLIDILNDAIRIRKGYEYDSEWVGEKIALYAK